MLNARGKGCRETDGAWARKYMHTPVATFFLKFLNKNVLEDFFELLFDSLESIRGFFCDDHFLLQELFGLCSFANGISNDTYLNLTFFLQTEKIHYNLIGFEAKI